MTEQEKLLVETVARHFPDAKTHDREVELGFGDVRISCRVDSLRDWGQYKSAALFFELRGGQLGPEGVFASISGYGVTPERAIVEGACLWMCSFGPVLRASVGGEDVPNVERFDVVADGQAFRVFVDNLDRAMMTSKGDPAERFQAARARFTKQRWLSRDVLESTRLPMLDADRASVLSVFVSDASHNRVVEVKVNGRDWPGMESVFEHVPREPDGAITLLRELAIVVPAGPTPALAKDSIERTLRGIADPAKPRVSVQWPGWGNHRGELAAPLSEEALTRLESRIGSLPEDYRSYLLHVSGSGAGPGYGLASPLGEAQAALAHGTFAWRDGETPTTSAAAVLVLAHAGCGLMWLLVLSGPHKGEVWLDARANGEQVVRRVAASFNGWYRAWIAALVRDVAPWAEWDARRCATANVLSQMLERLEREGVPRERWAIELPRQLAPEAISLITGANDYFPQPTELNPCQGCVLILSRFGLGADAFKKAEESRFGPRPTAVFRRRTSDN